MTEERGGSGRSSVWVREEGRGASCGVQGCLFLAVALFTLLLVAMLLLLLIRFGSPS